MFYYIEGKVAVIEPYIAVIDCGGVGYACHTSSNTISYLNIGERAKLYTYCNVKEDCFDIYGFYTMAELNCFKMMIGISGVGPKAALSILSANDPQSLALAVVSGNEKALMVAQGIGKKLAQRIILELKDKLGKEMDSMQFEDAVPNRAGIAEDKISDVTAALTVLGYQANEIMAAMKKIDMQSLSVEDIIKEILRSSVK